MNSPAVVSLRISRQYHTNQIPYNVEILLPPPDVQFDHCIPRTKGPILDIVFPGDPTRHTKLGMFMDSWARLEAGLGFLLNEILKTNLLEAHLILSRLGAKNTIDVFTGLGLRKLSEQSGKELERLLDRLARMNQKRNVLVHGHWTLEAYVIARNREAVLMTQFVREAHIIDPDTAAAISNPKNQKDRVRWCFTLKRIEAAIRETDTLFADFNKFREGMTFKPRESLPWPQSMPPAPYRVTYSFR